MPSTSHFNWNSVGATHVGLVRQSNEDAFLELGDSSLWVVADGMGGHYQGALASQMVIDEFRNFAPAAQLADTVDELEDRLMTANWRCFNTGHDQGQIMGSTAALLYAANGYCFALWAGDSRIYRLRDGALEQLTEDHSLVHDMVKMGHLSAAEAQQHPSSNIITRAVGVAEELFVDAEYFSVQHGDRFLLCTDGLNRDSSDAEIMEILVGTEASEACKQLIDLALHRGGYDNVTTIVADAR